MTIGSETGFHFRRGDRLVLAMVDAEPRWGFDEVVDETVFDDRLARLAHRYPAAAGTTIDRAWAGLYDMTPDAHPIIGWVGDGVYAACGFSGHGFMQSPAVGGRRPPSSSARRRSTSLRTASSALEGAVFPRRSCCRDPALEDEPAARKLVLGEAALDRRLDVEELGHVHQALPASLDRASARSPRPRSTP